MSEKSPLFVSAIELLAHATELYTQGNEGKYKFIISSPVTFTVDNGDRHQMW